MQTSKMEEKQMFGINGMEQSDTGALTPEQQQKLNDFKVTLLLFFVSVKIRMAREGYNLHEY